MFFGGRLAEIEKCLASTDMLLQTGFVPGQGVFTNIFRAIKRIKERTNNKQHIYGLFIDFKSAYNYTRHDLLFERFEKVLDKNEITFQKAIYDKILIQAENATFRPIWEWPKEALFLRLYLIFIQNRF